MDHARQGPAGADADDGHARDARQRVEGARGDGARIEVSGLPAAAATRGRQSMDLQVGRRRVSGTAF
ncbi:hypothetical protein BLAT2472_90075 [Burkholderia latens]